MTKNSLSADEKLRYSQHIKLAEIGLSGQEKLKNARVLCIGLGGLGSSVLLHLAASGVGRLGLVDDDIVELSNLHRQVLYHLSQVSLSKTASALAQISAINPKIQVDTYFEKLTEKNAANLISQYDIVADGSDNFYTNYLIHDVCFKHKKAYVYASATQFQGYCSLFSGSDGPCLRCLFPTPPDPNLIPSCESGGVLGTLPGLLGTIQATEIIKWILGIGNLLEKRLLIINLLKMSFKEIHLFQSPDCQLCVLQNPLSQLNYPATCLNLESLSINSNEMFELLKQPNVTLVDVRSAKEYEAQNIGGKLMPLSELPARIQELNPNHTIILYCHSGKRSLLALNTLLEAGFSSLRYLNPSHD